MGESGEAVNLVPLAEWVRIPPPPSFNDMEWRDANIVPRYNAVGAKKFAFVMPAGMPLIGNDPEAEGPAAYPTGYFGTREDALGWLAS